MLARVVSPFAACGIAVRCRKRQTETRPNPTDPPMNLPDASRFLTRNASPFATVCRYLPSCFACVSPAPRNARSAIPVAATRSVFCWAAASNCHPPSGFCCFASHASPRATASSLAAFSPRSEPGRGFGDPVRPVNGSASGAPFGTPAGSSATLSSTTAVTSGTRSTPGTAFLMSRSSPGSSLVMSGTTGSSPSTVVTIVSSARGRVGTVRPNWATASARGSAGRGRRPARRRPASRGRSRRGRRAAGPHTGRGDGRRRSRVHPRAGGTRRPPGV